MTSNNFVRDNTLCRQTVVLDGLTGTGKTMMCPLLSSFRRQQNARFEYMFEYLSILSKNQKIQKDATEVLLRLLTDVKLYDGMISREVNFRVNDLSSVFKGSKGFKYVAQLFQKDGSAVENRIALENPSLLLVTHQLLGCLEPAIKALEGKLKVIEMVRHPLYLLDHWLSNMDMYGSSSRDFTLWVDCDGCSIPWFAKDWGQLYISSTMYDRVIYSINELFKPVFENLQKSDTHSEILFIPFEQFVKSPNQYLKKIELFIEDEMTNATLRVLKSQRVPRKSINDGPQKSIYKRYGLRSFDPTITDKKDYENMLKKAMMLTSNESRGVLLSLIDQYELNFGLWF